jgi:hypothetical protein
MNSAETLPHHTTFVTAFFALKETPYFEKHPEQWDPSALVDLIRRSDMHICVYVGDDVDDAPFAELESTYGNRVKVMPHRIVYDDLWVHRLLQQKQQEADGGAIQLPVARNEEKDTWEYLTYMHSRVEWMEDAVSENPWNSTHFAWIDFNAPTWFRDQEAVVRSMQEIATYPYPTTTTAGVCVPGCWPAFNADSVRGAASAVYWRFCGPFFFGSGDALCEFARLSRHHLPRFLAEHRTLPWEVNFWAWMEEAGHWRPTWYRGDHDDRLVTGLLPGVSADTLAFRLLSSPGARQTYTYDYPVLDGGSYLPGSACYLDFRGTHLLNTRFVNYWMYPNGYYRFHDPSMVIGNRNLVSTWDPQLRTAADFREVGADGACPPLQLPPVPEGKRAVSEGLEDIRLYDGGAPYAHPRFIATNVNFSATGRNRMVVGTYNVATCEYEDCVMVVPPDPASWCEKNWIPLLLPDLDSDEPREHFIYKWSPLEIGRLVLREASAEEPSSAEITAPTNATHLQIVHRFVVHTWIFSRLRGSTVFVDLPPTFLPAALRNERADSPDTRPEYVVGLTHFSEEHSPRHYYHVMVVLEKRSGRPVRHSPVFYFDVLGVEFCIGLRVDDAAGQYLFWISRFDRDPLCVAVDKESIALELPVRVA